MIGTDILIWRRPESLFHLGETGWQVIPERLAES
jgi:hypothetical protein